MDDCETYECLNCGAIFSGREMAFHTEVERHYWLDGSPAEVLTMWCCPECGSSDIDVHDENEEE